MPRSNSRNDQALMERGAAPRSDRGVSDQDSPGGSRTMRRSPGLMMLFSVN